MEHIKNAVKLILKGACKNLARMLFAKDRLTDMKIRREIMRGLQEPLLVDEEACIGCGVCKHVCPTGAITMVPLDKPVKLSENRIKTHVPHIDREKCVLCFYCHDSCLVLTAYHKPSAIHPRGIVISGNSARDFFGVKKSEGGEGNA